VEDVMPIATGLEREEIEAELQVSPHGRSACCRRFISYNRLFVGKKINFVGLVCFFLYRGRRDSTWTRPSVPLAPR
jgi:hypothetical protein